MPSNNYDESEEVGYGRRDECNKDGVAKVKTASSRSRVPKHTSYFPAPPNVDDDYKYE